MPDTPLNEEALEAGTEALMDASFGQYLPEAPIDLATAAIRAYLSSLPADTLGYIIVDKKTRAIDWDGELHPSIEAAIESMTGPHQSMCRTAEEEDDAANDGRTAWWRVYSVHSVTARPEVCDA